MAQHVTECPHLTKMIEALSNIKVKIRNLDSKSEHSAGLIASISELESYVHECASEIEQFKQDLLDDYATTLFQTHTQHQSVNPFIITKPPTR